MPPAGVSTAAVSTAAVSTAGSGHRVVGVSTRLVDAVVDKAHARLATGSVEPVVVTSADIEEVERITRRVEALRLALIAAADRQQAHRRSGHTSTSAWVASATRSAHGTAQRDVAVATALADGLDRTRSAFAAGAVSSGNARIIATTMSKLPDTLTPVERVKVETSLVRDATRMSPTRFHHAAQGALAAAERSAADVADHVENQLLEQERRAYRLATVTMHDLGDGTTKLAALLPTFAARTLHKVLQTMTSPRRDHLRKTAEAALADGQTPAGHLDDGSVAADLLNAGPHESSRGEGKNADWADLDWAHRRGRALTELIEHLDTDKLTGRVAATVIITMTAEQVFAAARTAQLQADVHATTGTLLEMHPSSGAATTDIGTQISASTARRLACQAGILPAILGGPSHILDLGRQHRFFNDHQRSALAALYDTCAADNCDRPYSWTELHHHDPWSKGGCTDLEKALPLCGYHHRLIHDPAYVHEVSRNPHAPGPTASGAKTVHFRLRT